MVVLYRVIQCTWGILQTAMGAILFLLHIHDTHYSYHGSVVTVWERDDNVSLGMFVFTQQYAPKRILNHEYGHTIQSLYFGPLYLLIFGIPSFFWCNMPRYRKLRRNRRIDYFSFYPEKLADRLGEKYIHIF